MNSNKLSSYMIVLGICILCVFAYISTINILELNNNSNIFFSKTEKTTTAKIEKIELLNNKLVINTNDNTKEICIKTTKTNPSNDSICWKKINNNELSTSIYEYKTYYIWVKDNENNISEKPLKYNKLTNN